jgi:hypothetical protein
MDAGIDFVLLDAQWRPRVRFSAATRWHDLLSVLIRLDGRWIAIDQRRIEDAPVQPDARDIALTRSAYRRLRPLDMVLTDHVIRAGGSRFSFRSAGLL